MEVIKEGTHTYLLRQIKYGKFIYDEAVMPAEKEQWNYYLSVEYEVLKRNKLKTLVSVQLREKDGEKSFLFDITGKCPLKRQGKERVFSKKKCEKILQSMISMIQEVDDYMLDLNCIEFQPEYIYEESEDEFYWIYFPRISFDSEMESGMQDRNLPNEDLQKRIEALFAWMLTQIDYEDTDAVQFMYQFYNKVRKRGFSKELLETCIQSEIQKEYYDVGETGEIYADEKESYSSKMKRGRMSNNESISYEEFFKEELESESERAKTEKQKVTKQVKAGTQMGTGRGLKGKNRRKGGQKNKDLSNKKQGDKKDLLVLYTILKIMSAMVTLIAAILEGMFVFYGISRGFTPLLFRYSVGGVLLIMVFICGFIWSTQKVRMVKQNSSKSTTKDDISSIETDIKIEGNIKKENQETQMSDRFISKNEFSNRPQMIRTEVDWESELEDTLISNSGRVSEMQEPTSLNYGRLSEYEGTTVLNYADMSEMEDNKRICPMLRDMDLGIVYIIKSCPFYIGSAEGVNHLQIQDKTVSREHAVILEDICGGEEQGYIIRDMDSTNGTWINGKRLKRGRQEQLEQGAIIRFAEKEYEFLNNKSGVYSHSSTK